MGVFVELNQINVAKEETFWKRLGKAVDLQCSCCEYQSAVDLVDHCTTRDRTRLCLIVDEMDHILVNKELATQFLNALRVWKSAENFCGFLGVGSHELKHIHESFSGNSSPFNVADMIKIESFSADQMSGFFKLIEPCYEFSQSLRWGIMKYSCGAPGVFGSIIRFTVDNNKWEVDLDQWEPWFLVNEFSRYMEDNNATYRRIQIDLCNLEDWQWEALKCILTSTGPLTASAVDSACSTPVTDNRYRRRLDRLLRMGVVIESKNGTLKIVSHMMRRVCLEALPARDIEHAVSTEDPVQLLTVALGYVNPATISIPFVKNRQYPSESVFHVELYSTLRDILKKCIHQKNICAEAKTPGNQRRADILITTGNGDKLAYELKSNQLCEAQITAAAEQADMYRQQFGVDGMLVVNFVSDGHTFDAVYRVKQVPMVEIVHVRFGVYCDRFEIFCLPKNGISLEENEEYCGRLTSSSLAKVKHWNVELRP